MAALKPEQIVVVQDSREQRPFCLDPMPVVIGTLPTADYSVRGLEDLVALERKSLDDLTSCMTTERDRFQRELQRLRSYRHRVVLVEASWSEIEAGEYRSRLNPKAAAHTIISWTANFSTPIFFAGGRGGAERWAKYFLFTCAKNAWAQTEQFRIAMEDGHHG